MRCYDGDASLLYWTRVRTDHGGVYQTKLCYCGGSQHVSPRHFRELVYLVDYLQAMLSLRMQPCETCLGMSSDVRCNSYIVTRLLDISATLTTPPLSHTSVSSPLGHDRRFRPSHPIQNASKTSKLQIIRLLNLLRTLIKRAPLLLIVDTSELRS
ncbi:hypothetical protein BD410DRAFT_789740 [Rickenella mellea]|uniref:Uncharacterized protein n=1 Tax=Rickenella mellea TaxID=50990 RepID=A0A4Y7Q0Z9_9AGAM|nr:hypothetical protein BD410DRAFT_789740 [Rickenella mellea]